MIARRVVELHPCGHPHTRCARNIQRYAERMRVTAGMTLRALSSMFNIQHPSGCVRLRRFEERERTNESLADQPLGDTRAVTQNRRPATNTPALTRRRRRLRPTWMLDVGR